MTQTSFLMSVWQGEEERELTADQQVAEGATGKLVITETKRSDAGLYECTVDNGITPPAKQAVRLVVRCERYRSVLFKESACKHLL